MDIADKAKERETLHRDESLARHRAAQQQEKPLIINGIRRCLDCHDPIDLRRIDASPGAVRCTECQQYHEKE